MGARTRSAAGARQAFLIRVAELLHAYGASALHIERVLEMLALHLEMRAEFLSSPTSMFLSFRKSDDNERVVLLRVQPGQIDLGKLVEFDEVADRVVADGLSPADAIGALDTIARAPARYHAMVGVLAGGVVSGSAARLFGGGLDEVALATALGLGVTGIGALVPNRPGAMGVFEPAAAFSVAFCAFVAAHTLLPGVDDRLTTLAGLLILFPGLALTVGMTELATRHLVSGVARLAGATATFLTMLFGVAIAWRVGPMLLGDAPTAAGAIVTSELPPAWTEWLALGLAPVAIGVLLGARIRELPIIFVASVAGFTAARHGSGWLGPDLGPFLGAVCVGAISNFYARVTDRPTLVPLTPAILLLVPGSLGFRSLTSFLDRDSQQGMEWAIQTGLIAASLVGGLLASHLVMPPRRTL